MSVLLQQPVVIAFLFFVAMLCLQQALPRRSTVKVASYRFWNNLALFGVNFVLFAIVPLSLSLVANNAEQWQFGILRIFDAPLWVELLIAVIALDFAIYWQHVLSHRWPLFWSVHKVHHLDLDFDVSTAVRFHPIELLVSLAYKSLLVAALGVSVAGVIIFEMLLIVGALFSHSNWRLPEALDRLLRLVVVTPDVHRVHHSIERKEHDTNYGFFLIWWDKIFHTYTHQPDAGHEEMPIGLAEREERVCSRIWGMLVAPLSIFRRPI